MLPGPEASKRTRGSGAPAARADPEPKAGTQSSIRATATTVEVGRREWGGRIGASTLQRHGARSRLRQQMVQLGLQDGRVDGTAEHLHLLAALVVHDRLWLADEAHAVADGAALVEHAGVRPPVGLDERPGR